MIVLANGINSGGNLDNDPTTSCGELRLRYETWGDAVLLAALFRFLNSPRRFSRLEQLVEQADIIASSERVSAGIADLSSKVRRGLSTI